MVKAGMFKRTGSGGWSYAIGLEMRLPKASSTRAVLHIAPSVDQVDTRFLQSLLGYNARRAALSIIGIFLDRMQPYDLRPVDFSVLSVIAHNPGVTSRQLCCSLGILPPNFVALLANLEKRGLVQRSAHLTDKRAVSLLLSATGRALMDKAELTVTLLERDASQKLSPTELKTLNRLLQKVYQNGASAKK